MKKTSEMPLVMCSSYPFSSQTFNCKQFITINVTWQVVHPFWYHTTKQISWELQVIIILDGNKWFYVNDFTTSCNGFHYLYIIFCQANNFRLNVFPPMITICNVYHILFTFTTCLLLIKEGKPTILCIQHYGIIVIVKCILLIMCKLQMNIFATMSALLVYHLYIPNGIFPLK